MVSTFHLGVYQNYIFLSLSLRERTAALDAHVNSGFVVFASCARLSNMLSFIMYNICTKWMSERIKNVRRIDGIVVLARRKKKEICSTKYVYDDDVWRSWKMARRDVKWRASPIVVTRFSWANWQLRAHAMGKLAVILVQRGIQSFDICEKLESQSVGGSRNRNNNNRTSHWLDFIIIRIRLLESQD